jgi:flagellar hook-associated protein 1 FlgK
MADLLKIGVTALTATKAGLDTTAHNVAQASNENYSRQRVNVETNPAFGAGNIFVGSGVRVSSIERIANTFVTENLRTQTTNYTQFKTQTASLNKLNDFLAQENTGLSKKLQSFFDAFQQASEDPQSLASRNVLLSQGRGLVAGVQAHDQFINEQMNGIDGQIAEAVVEINQLASQIAELNGEIAANPMANDLLDERDALILSLSEWVDVSSVSDGNNSLNIFLGTGQPLVLRESTYRLSTRDSDEDPEKLDVFLSSGAGSRAITDTIQSGALGGFLMLRDQVLDPALKDLGALSMGLSEVINQAHQNGMNLNNQIGGLFFQDINATDLMRERVIGDKNNDSLTDGVIEVEVSDVSKLTSESYRLEMFESGNYTITRMSDDEIVGRHILTDVFPSSVEFDGLKISLVEGTFHADDIFYIEPTKSGAKNFGMVISDPKDLAFAQPVKALSSVSNRGTGRIDKVSVSDTSANGFLNNALNPPLTIRFTSATTYDVLDATDRENPTQLVPPLSNQTFVPGTKNLMLPQDLDQTALTSLGADIASFNRSATENGYSEESVSIVRVDQTTGAITKQVLDINANTSAKEMAESLNLISGVSASSRNYIKISELNSASPLGLSLNGENLSSTNLVHLSDEINNNAALTNQGIFAVSDGDSIVIRANTGIDFTVDITGTTANDSIRLENALGDTVDLVGTDATSVVTLGGVVDLVLDEDYFLSGESNLFELSPTVTPRFFGYQMTLSGNPVEGDEYQLLYNTDGFSDNRNVLDMASVRDKKVHDSGRYSLIEWHFLVLDRVADQTSDSQRYEISTQTLWERSKQDKAELSGVDLDEEGVNLIKLEQQYNAASRLISIAKSVFDELLRAVGN